MTFPCRVIGAQVKKKQEETKRKKTGECLELQCNTINKSKTLQGNDRKNQAYIG